jgi:hypothetical protein
MTRTRWTFLMNHVVLRPVGRSLLLAKLVAEDHRRLEPGGRQTHEPAVTVNGVVECRPLVAVEWHRKLDLDGHRLGFGDATMQWTRRRGVCHDGLRVSRSRSRYGRDMPDASDRASAMLLLVACALVGHLLMLADIGMRPAEQHSGMRATAADAGLRSSDRADPSSHEGSATTEHAMATTCLAVLAAGGLILELHRGLALRESGPTPGSQRSVTTWRRLRDLWPPPRPDAFLVDGGALLLV